MHRQDDVVILEDIGVFYVCRKDPAFVTLLDLDTEDKVKVPATVLDRWFGENKEYS